jgi:GDPmannose 4,6-dehydratase
VAERLQRAGDRVYGLERQSTIGRSGGGERPYLPVSGDLLDDYSLLSLMERLQPEEIYNFAAQSFIPTSWEQPVLTAQYTGLGVVRLLEALRRSAPKCRLLQAGSSELFAGGTESPQRETTPIAPRNPYGVAKAFAFHTVRIYRERYRTHACNAVFYTNESPRRSPEFLFRKVTRGVAEIAAGKRSELSLGDLEARRDWGYAPDYAEAAVRVLRHDEPADFVIATGRSRSVRELVERAFSRAGLDWRACVRVDPQLVRPPERLELVGDPSRAREILGWAPSLGFDQLIDVMLAEDFRQLGLTLPDAGAAAR